MIRCGLRMARLLGAALLVAGLCLSAPARAGAGYSFGVVPQFEAREMAAIWIPILAELAKRTGLALTMKGSPRIPEFEIAFEAGEFDFAYMNPYHAMIAARKQGYLPLVRDAEPLYGVLAVRKDSVEVAGRMSLRVQGYHLDMKQRIEIGAHQQRGAEGVWRWKGDLLAGKILDRLVGTVLGISEASGGVKASFDRQKPDRRESLRIIYETRKVPPHPILAHPRVPEAHRALLKQALLAMAATPEGAALLNKIPMSHPTSASKDEYALMSKLKLDKFYVKSGD